MKEFKELEHTADVGIEVWGKTLEELFTNALSGLYFFAIKNKECKKGKKIVVEVEGQNLEDLLVVFLSELNFYLMAKHQYFKTIQKFTIKQEKGFYLLKCFGEICVISDINKNLKMEIKAVTYHQVEIIQKDDIFYTRIFFDI